MLDRGVDIDALTDFVKIQGREGDRRKSHLHYACEHNSPSVARVLLLHGADMFCAHNHFNYGKTPLDYVRTFCHLPYKGDTKELIALFDRAAPSYWRGLFALTFGQMKTRAELAGQRIAPLIGAFLVGDVLKKREVPSEAARIAATRPAYSSRERRRS